MRTANPRSPICNLIFAICNLKSPLRVCLSALVPSWFLLATLTQAATLSVYPPDANLSTSASRQSIIVQLTNDDGTTTDVTSQSTFTLQNPTLAKLDKNTLTPLSDGATKLTIKYKSLSQSLPVTIKNAKLDRPISFKLDVMPVISQAGCNVGSCHGSARGKDGFHLSLFGYDPDGDYDRITREQATRRLNLSIPEDSLFLQKAIGSVAHTGGKRFETNSESYKAIFRWIDGGAQADPERIAHVTGVEIYPPESLLRGPGVAQQLGVRAKYSDGTERDVTPLAVYISNNDASAAVSKEGIVTAVTPGESFILARFSTFTVGTQVLIIPKDAPASTPELAENNYIDHLINAKLRKMRITPAPLCSDEAFLRRACIDITGQLPTREEYDTFLASKDPSKREKLVDELLSRKEFVEIWVMKFAELLQIRSNNDRVSYKAALRYYDWLDQRISHNVPFDQIVQELLSATGGSFSNPAANYYQVETDPLKIAENTAQVFMGMRIQCAQCHNHPFDRWTMNDYYSFVSFFTQIGRKKGEDPRETIVFNSGGGEHAHPITKKPLPPRFLGAEEPDAKERDRRVLLAKWLASPKNPYFAKNLANIVWSHFFGRGIINPVDDARISNPPSNPELLAALGEKFTDYHYDFKRIVRDICLSRTYQLSAETNPTNELDERNFSHSAIRRLRAEVLLDCISQVTDTKDKFKGLPVGSHAVQIADGQVSTYFLTTFGRATRETACSCEVSMEPNLSQALHLLNGDTVNQKCKSGGVVSKLLAQKKTPDQILDELYLRTLTRHPTPEEISLLNSLMTQEKDPKKFLEDTFWALLNSQEFIFNH
jgi:hypothetical protein